MCTLQRRICDNPESASEVAPDELILGRKRVFCESVIWRGRWWVLCGLTFWSGGYGGWGVLVVRYNGKA